MSLFFQPLPVDNVLEYWPYLDRRLQQALEHSVGESTLTDWLRALLNGNAQLWPFFVDDHIHGAGLTQFINYNRCRTLHVVLIQVDDFAKYGPWCWQVLEEFGKANNCIAAESWGRPGWAKTLPKLIPGFKPAYQVMRKDFFPSTEDSK